MAVKSWVAGALLASSVGAALWLSRSGRESDADVRVLPASTGAAHLTAAQKGPSEADAQTRAAIDDALRVLDTEGAERADALKRLEALFGADALTIADLLCLALLPGRDGDEGRLRERAVGHLHRLGPGAASLTPRLFDLLEGGSSLEKDVAADVLGAIWSDHHPNVMSRLASALRSSTEPVESAPIAIIGASYLPRIRALIESESTPSAARLAMLPIVERLGPAAVSLAPALVSWIRAIAQHREDHEREPPGRVVRLVHWGAEDFHIASALGAMGEGALPAVLEGILGESNSHGRYALHLALREMAADALPALRPLLAHARADVRESALVAFARLDPGPTGLEQVRKGLRDPSALVRRTAAELLQGFGADAAPDLVAALSDPDGSVRSAAAAGLAKAPEAASRAAARVVELFREGTFGERFALLEVLPSLGERGLDAVPGLVQMLGQGREPGHLPPWRLEERGLQVLEALGPGAVPRVAEQAGSSDPDVRRGAVFALQRLPGVGAAHLAPLSGDLDRRTGVERIELAGLLVRTGDARALAVLEEALEAEDDALRVAAAKALWYAGARGVASIPALAAGLRRTSADLHAPGAHWSKEFARLWAYHKALTEVGKHVPDRMLLLLEDANHDVRDAAADALEAAGAAGAEAIRRGRGGLDSAARVRLVPVLSTHAFSEPRSAPAYDLLVESLSDPDPRVRLAAAERLFRDEATRGRVIDLWLRTLAEPRDLARVAARQLRSHATGLAELEPRLKTAHADALDPAVKEDLRRALDAIADDRLAGG